MPDRLRQRKHTPFVALPRHKRRNAAVRLGWRIRRNAAHTGNLEFWTDHLLEDPDAPERQHQWVDVYFLGCDRFTLWNAEIITTELAVDDAIRERAFAAAYARLSAQEHEFEFSPQWKAVPRKQPGAMRRFEWVSQPAVHYSQFDGRTFRVDHAVVWQTLQHDLPALQKQITALS